MSELETEHTYQLRQAEANQAEKLKEVHEGYCAAIEELKEKNEVTMSMFFVLPLRTVEDALEKHLVLFYCHRTWKMSTRTK